MNIYSNITNKAAWQGFPLTNSLAVYPLLGSAIKGESLFNANDLTGTTTFTTSIRFNFIVVPKAVTLTGVKWIQAVAGAYTAATYNGVGLYSINLSDGLLTLVASSTNDGNIWKATANTIALKAFTSTYAAAAGIYFIAASYNNSAQTTAPTIMSTLALANATIASMDFANSVKLNGTIAAAAALPSTQASSGITAAIGQMWFGAY